MKLINFYNQVVHFGRLADPRKAKGAIKSFPDSAILFGDPGLEIKKIMVGIDIEVGDLLLADRIRQKEGLDLVIAHHPEGKAYVGLHEVMRLQIDLLTQAGVAQSSAARLVEERMAEVERRVMPQNHTRPVDAARLLNLPFMNMHTPADNHVYRYLEAIFKQKSSQPRLVEDVVKVLNTIAEYQIARKFNTGPRIILGNPKRPVGKILFEMTGGTEGSKDVFDKLYKAGVRTLVSMHLSEEHFKKVKDANLNVVIAGHISSDTLGLNLLLDNIEKYAKQDFEVIACSGFTRIKRK
ncbi:MAG: NGG1p interacting factor NIF3 [Candidatus Omnitrophica bacterium]|nr:NGG1p interacting factor NIF3 [Candidatus Omnitrophota bacterium]MBU4303413.1 NGG1p interacting factor NIF3 [Candidatus Omnitrophota bacterium]MBU4419300.1 NGG1p interacting factor NIF3 [Candidatus Omnitrophota bacterium]MBU4468799.1 NGG1p interacting factor NIF3 [Candidatus Omnitrophota bacterium]MCG2708086.1 NGG1p interacting factor NIF3 [Candidatus Omnitrophota bacterium]